jgi:hypothetical protein
MGELDLPRLGVEKLAHVGNGRHVGKEKGIDREKSCPEAERGREGE